MLAFFCSYFVEVIFVSMQGMMTEPMPKVDVCVATCLSVCLSVYTEQLL